MKQEFLSPLGRVDPGVAGHAWQLLLTGDKMVMRTTAESSARAVPGGG